MAGFHSRTVPVLAGDGQQLAVRAERHPVTPSIGAGVSREGGADGLTGGRIPQPHGAGVAGGGQQLAVRAERHAEHALRAGSRREGSADGLLGDRVPQPHGAVAVGCGQQLAVRAERHCAHAVLGWITGQDAALLLLHQQVRQDGAGLVGGEDAPGSHGQPPCGEGIGGVGSQAFGRELAG